jgi:hypothetical protein
MNMNERETSFQNLKDQMKSLKPISNPNLNLADYNSLQFSRTSKNLKPQMNK